MSDKIKNYLGIAGIIAILFVAYSAVSLVGVFGRMTLPSATFSVEGKGKVVAIPDIASFSYSVITEGDKDIAKLQDKNAEKGNAILKLLKENDVEDKDVKTSSYNISPRYTTYNCWDWKDTTKPCPPQYISGYTVSQSVSVKVRDFKKISELLAGVANLGANDVSSLSFSVENPDILKDSARADAIKQAREKAQAIASAAGFKIGRLIEESEATPYQYYGYGGGMMMDAAPSVSAKAVAPEVAAGSQDINVTVTLRYEIL